HLLLHADLLRHAVIFKSEIARLQTVKNAAAALFYKGRHQHLGCCHTQICRLALRDRHGLRRFNGRQLLRRSHGHLRKHYHREEQNTSPNPHHRRNHSPGRNCFTSVLFPTPYSLSFHTRLRASRSSSPVQARKRRSSPRVVQRKPSMLLAVIVSARRPE